MARRYGRVADRYLIWNEPNQPLWLQPQQECPVAGRRCTPGRAAHLPRRSSAPPTRRSTRADPGAQVIAGDARAARRRPAAAQPPAAPAGLHPRASAASTTRYKPIRTGRCRGFRPARIDGFAYHPHAIKASPVDAVARTATTPPSPTCRKLEDTLDAVQRARGFTTPTGAHAPLHLTEFGYQTNPPDPYDGIPPARQSRWLQEAAYLAWRDPRVRTLVQYEWQDERGQVASAPGRKRYAGWQSGLLFANGKSQARAGRLPAPVLRRRDDRGTAGALLGPGPPGPLHTTCALQRASPTRRLGDDRAAAH